jgi:hypothetical protein
MPIPVLVLQVVGGTATVRFITAKCCDTDHVAMLVSPFKACIISCNVVISNSTNYHCKLLYSSCAEIVADYISLLALYSTAS